jgi:signal transduction histidine kinase
MGTHGAGVRQRALPPGRQADGGKADKRARLASINIDSFAKGRRMMNLADWPVARRLFAVIVAALLMGLVFGGLRVADTLNSANQFSRTLQLSRLSAQLIVVTQDLEIEEDATDIALITTQSPQQAGALTTLERDQAKTNSDLVPVTASLNGVLNGGFPAAVTSAANAVKSSLAGLGPALTPANQATATTGLHALFNNAPASGDGVLPAYESDIKAIEGLQTQVSLGVTDQSLNGDVQTLGALTQMDDLTSEERTVFDQSLSNTPNSGVVDGNGNPTAGTVPFSSVTQLALFTTEEEAAQNTFNSSATQPELTEFDSLQGPEPAKLDGETEANNILTAFNSAASGGANNPNEENADGTSLKNFIANQLNGPMGKLNLVASLQGNDTTTNAAGQTVPDKSAAAAIAAARAQQKAEAVTGIPSLQTRFDTGTNAELGATQTTEQFVANNIVSRASQLQQSAQQSAIVFAIITIAVLIIVLAGALLVAQSLVQPLRRLRAGALDIASVQLPERVRLLSEDPQSADGMAVAPIDVSAQDEIGQVARAFDQVHSEAVRLAGEQALLRSNFNAMFVNLSRRSQTLIERLARQIDTLEQTEDDPDRLGSLFSMDHMVTRMRRNSENLLLLAGHENARKRAEPAPIADIARAAVSEIEQYNRVVLNIPPGISVVGQAVSDVVHLLAELMENATIFSPKDSQVQVSMQELTSGGALVEILDRGIGISEARLTDLNWRLDNPPTIDVGVSRHMGLFAVARLAERHRVRVRLRPASPQGLSALVWLPDGVIERTGGLTGAMSTAYSTQPVAAQARLGGAGTATLPAAGAPVVGGGVGLATDDYAGANGFGDADVATSFGDGNGFGSGPGRSNGFGAGNGVSRAKGNGASRGSDAEPRTATGWFRGGADAPTELSGPGALGGRADFMTSEAPVADSTTSSGLPVRRPRANMPPGMTATTAGPELKETGGLRVRSDGGGLPTRTAGASGRAQGNPALGAGGDEPLRSPELIRSRLSGFQRGTRRAAEGQTDRGGQAPFGGEGTSQ